MKKFINIWSFVGKTNREAMKIAKDAGFEGIELALGKRIFKVHFKTPAS